MRDRVRYKSISLAFLSAVSRFVACLADEGG
jgi:hypothetical protein